MKSIEFFGAAGMVTGSCYVLTSDKGEKVVVDLGLFQEGEKEKELNTEPLSFNAAEVSGVVLTHAHLDHCGRLPLLVKAGYTGKIYMTSASRMLVALVLMDAARVAEENQERMANGEGGMVEKNILYTQEDVERMLELVEIIDYDKEFSIGSFKVTFRDAGHILGSASIEIEESGKKIVFSGDLGNTPEDMIRATEFVHKADYVVMESTYGDTLHKEEDPNVVLLEEIGEIEKTGGVLLIPSFSIERAQELLHRINHLKLGGKISKELKVYLDSPMAIRATEIFRRSPEFYNTELKKDFKDDDPFDFPGLVMASSVEESKEILHTHGAKVIISGSGMMHGGRIIHHASHYLDNPNTRLLMVGYQAVGTLGRRLLDGEKNVEIRGRMIEVRANIRNVEAMSCHADQKKLLKWLKKIEGVEKVFLTHGDDDARTVLAEKIKTELHLSQVFLPKPGERQEF